MGSLSSSISIKKTVVQKTIESVKAQIQESIKSLNNDNRKKIDVGKAKNNRNLRKKEKEKEKRKKKKRKKEKKERKKEKRKNKK